MIGTLQLQNMGIYFSGTFGLNAGGTITKITNGENFPIVLISRSSGTNCSGAGNTFLGPHGSTTSANLTSLYGSSTIKYPTTLGACVSSSLLSEQLITLSITYTPGT